MNSPSDPSCGAEEPAQGRSFVPKGPWLDAWRAPGGGAEKLSIRVMKMEARWLRRARPRPFGFAPGSTHPLPQRLGEAHGSGNSFSFAASMLGLPTPVHTMTVSYGAIADPQAPAASVTSDFHRDYQERELEGALLGAAAKWAGQEAAPDAVVEDGQFSDSLPEVASGKVDVVVLGKRRSVSLLRLREFSAFQVGEEGVLVTVVARQMGPEFPEIVRLGPAGLEPMLSAMENPDRDLIAAAFAEMRRRRAE